ncbi:fasciclin domain-containing protein [Methanoculleus sp. FWC-SCC1]|uniref:Fasciclin domain-containing protein n=1 Tax=Methanoculleus frigidifontis TaxID=2584085 RepID=A0ABT8MDI0_9EURY|nr:fasciclin domain-containing protein [Methanoculleus sp. FWC-SCC1]MDN7025986.1 fasciclin domain-containing protein [Methanoculleus sp. FWC-SCC1]
MKNIYETAREAAELTRFVDAVRAAGLQDLLSGEGPFTVFAPTNEAFGKVSGRFRPAMQNHVVRARISTADIRQQGTMRIGTVGGDAIAVAWSPDAGQLTVEDARIIQADIAATNGVIHIVDYLIRPAAVETAAR